MADRPSGDNCGLERRDKLHCQWVIAAGLPDVSAHRRRNALFRFLQDGADTLVCGGQAGGRCLAHEGVEGLEALGQVGQGVPIRGQSGTDQLGAVALFTDNLINRTDAYAVLIKMALAKFRRPDLYENFSPTKVLALTLSTHSSILLIYGYSFRP